MVAYVSILIFTVLILTYITYKVSVFTALNFSPQTVLLCGVFACVLGLLAPQVVAYAANKALWLTALLSLLVLSSYVLSKQGLEESSHAVVPANSEGIDIVEFEETTASAVDCTAKEHRLSPVLDSNSTTPAEVEEPDMPEPTNTENEPFVNETDNRDFAYFLDLGFNAKEAHNYYAATIAFQKAIDVEPDNPAVLYIITEICALLQLQGYYDEAVEQMQKGRDLAIAFQDHSMANEFIDGIAYIRILKNMLLTMRIPFTPYPALAEEVKLAIDEEFRQWKNL